jgi:flagellar protein FlaF
MGFSVSAAFAVAIIAGFIALGMLYPAVSGGFESVSQASQDAGERRLNAVNTEINVTRACFDAGTNQLEVGVDNVGSTSLGLDRTHVLVDNVYQTSYVSRDVNGNANTAVWAPGQTVNYVFSYAGNSVIESVPGEAGRVTVATEHGIRDSRGIGSC